MKASACRLAVLLILAAATTVNSEKVLRRRRAKVVEVESSSAFVESLWESDGIRNEKPMKELPTATTVDVKKETREEKAQKIEEEVANVERVLMGETRMLQDMSMSFFMMF